MANKIPIFIFLSLLLYSVFFTTVDTIRIAKSKILESSLSYYDKLARQGGYPGIKRDIKKLSSRHSTEQNKFPLNLFPSSGHFEYQLARAGLLHSSFEKDLLKKQSILCSSLSFHQEILPKSPASPYFSTAFADNLQLVSKNSSLNECDATKGKNIDFRNQLIKSESLAPNLSFSLYNIALIWLRAGSSTESLSLLKRIQENSLTLSYQFYQSLFPYVDSADNLALLLPEELPQILNWLNHFSFHDNQKLSDYNEILLSSSFIALDKLEEKMRTGKISHSLYHKYLKRLSRNELSSRNNNLRKNLDELLSVYYKKHSRFLAARLYKERSGLEAVSVNKSFLESDYEPESLDFTRWFKGESKYHVDIASKNFSLGVESKDKKISHLYLESSTAYPAIDKENLKIYLSRPEGGFQSCRSCEVIHHGLIDGRQVIFYSINPEHNGVIKILYKDFGYINSKAKFSNNLLNLAKVFSTQ